MKTKIIEFFSENKVWILIIIFGLICWGLFWEMREYKTYAEEKIKPTEIELAFIGLEDSREKRTVLQEQIDVLLAEKEAELERTNQYKQIIISLISE